MIGTYVPSLPSQARCAKRLPGGALWSCTPFPCFSHQAMRYSLSVFLLAALFLAGCVTEPAVDDDEPKVYGHIGTNKAKKQPKVKAKPVIEEVITEPR